MKNLLKTDFPLFYGIKRHKIDVPTEHTDADCFDLDDKTVSMIVDFEQGNVSFYNNNNEEVEVIGYEKYVNGLSGTSFEKGRKRCDFIITVTNGSEKSMFMLNEQTSTLETTENLKKVILDKDKNVLFPGGKYEKAETQLAESLRTLLAVPGIAEYLSEFKNRLCLMSYVINHKERISGAASAFANRYRLVEARETGEDGALLDNTEINRMHFEYRRISHDYKFTLD